MIRSALGAAARVAAELAEPAAVALGNWWARALGRGAAWDEGRDAALCNAAMLAHDMGRPDIRQAINSLIPDGSPFIPLDDPRHPRHAAYETADKLR